MNKSSSYRTILKTSSIIGSSSVINILIGLIRTKFLALLLGPAAIGLVGLYTGLMATATTISSVSIGMVGTKQIAASVAKEDIQAVVAWQKMIFQSKQLLK